MRSIFRYFRALGYLLTGKIDKARSSLESNVNVVRATFDNIEKEKKERIQEFHGALSELVAQQEREKHRLKQTNDKIEQLTKLKEGTIAKAKQIVASFNGRPCGCRS